MTFFAELDIYGFLGCFKKGFYLLPFPKNNPTVDCPKNGQIMPIFVPIRLAFFRTFGALFWGTPPTPPPPTHPGGPGAPTPPGNPPGGPPGIPRWFWGRFINFFIIFFLFLGA